jgi:hypothetical protein
MARTVQVHGSDEVMAMFGEPGRYYRGKLERIRVTGISKDEDIPLEVRAAVVGLTIPTIFTKESIESQTGIKLPVPEGTRLAYAADVAEALRFAGKHKEAEQLASVAPDPLDMYTIESDCYICKSTDL